LGSRLGGDGRTGLASFYHRDFTLLIVGKLLGWIALHMTLFAIQFQVYDRTGDVANLAYIGLASFAPGLGFALFTGYVADLFDRRLVIAVCYVIVFTATAMLFWYTQSGMAAVWPVFVILLFEGTGRAFHQPAISSLIPNIVPPETFPNAVAWHSTVNKVCQVAGPAAGGLVYNFFGPDTVYGAGGIMLLIATVTTLMIRTRTNRGMRQPTTLTTLLAGLRYVYAKKIIFGAITLDLFVVLLGGVTALFPVFAIDILHVGADGAGFLRAAIAAGALVSGLALTQIDLNRNVGHVMFSTVLIFGGATIAFGFSQLYWVSLLAMAILGAADMVSVNIRVTLMQIATPDDMRGRVSAVSSVFTGTSNELGEFRAGMMAAWLGTVPAVLVGGVGSILVAAICWKAFPELARVKRFEEVAANAPR
jgi:MFS family permease